MLKLAGLGGVVVGIALLFLSDRGTLFAFIPLVIGTVVTGISVRSSTRQADTPGPHPLELLALLAGLALIVYFVVIIVWGFTDPGIDPL